MKTSLSMVAWTGYGEAVLVSEGMRANARRTPDGAEGATSFSYVRYFSHNASRTEARIVPRRRFGLRSRRPPVWIMCTPQPARVVDRRESASSFFC